MSKRAFWTNKQKPTRRDLPDVVEQFETNEVHKITLLMEEAAELKAKLDKDVDDDEYDPLFHVARRFEDVKEKLGEIQSEAGLEQGMRYGELYFNATLELGKTSYPINDLRDALLSIDVINDAMNAAKRVGDSYWKRELSLIREKRTK